MPASPQLLSGCACLASVLVGVLVSALWLLLSGCAPLVGVNSHFQLCDRCTLVDHSCAAEYEAVLLVLAAILGYGGVCAVAYSWAKKPVTTLAQAPSPAANVDQPASQQVGAGETVV